MSNTEYTRSLMLTEHNIKDCINKRDKLIFNSAIQAVQGETAVNMYAKNKGLTGETVIKRRKASGVSGVEWTLVWKGEKEKKIEGEGE